MKQLWEAERWSCGWKAESESEPGYEENTCVYFACECMGTAWLDVGL